MAGATRLAVVLVLAAASGPACLQDTTTEPAPPLTIHCSANPASGVGAAHRRLRPRHRGCARNALGGDPVRRRHARARIPTRATSTAPPATTWPRSPSPRASRPPAARSRSPWRRRPLPTPTPRAANQPPAPDFRTTPPASGTALTGTAPFRVEFNMCRTVDPDDDRAATTRWTSTATAASSSTGSSGVDCRHGATYAVGTRTATLCVTDMDCPSWPLCDDYAPLHPFQCRSYTVTAVP